MTKILLVTGEPNFFEPSKESLYFDKEISLFLENLFLNPDGYFLITHSSRQREIYTLNLRLVHSTLLRRKFTHIKVPDFKIQLTIE